MPRELKKRGRREETKRKAQEAAETVSPKRQRTDLDREEPPPVLQVHGDAGDDFIRISDNLERDRSDGNQFQNEFYGMLEEEEQSYYASVNSKLNSNDFASDEDRATFIDAVHRETQGKEIKVASSQSCSRYLEKVIMLSTADQLQSLFTAFLENLTYLVQHRFGSHCCEALFIHAAKYVKVENKSNSDESDLGELFLQATDALKPNLGFLVTDRFATHVVRVLLLVLSGEEPDEETSKMIASRRKEKIDLPDIVKPQQNSRRKVPKSFSRALNDMILSLFSGMDTTYIRALATHPTGNPLLQLILKVELTGGKDKSKTPPTLYSRLLPDEELNADTESGKFIQGLIYDPTGSHLVEILIQHLPGKMFKKLYNGILKDRMRNLAKNDIASYIAIRVLERLGKDDLIEAIALILPEIPPLIHRSRLGLIKTLFERCTAREADSTLLTKEVVASYESNEAELLSKMLHAQLGPEPMTRNVENGYSSLTKADVHGALLAQSMLRDAKAHVPIEDSLLAQSQEMLVLMAKNPVTSRVIQVALTSKVVSPKFQRQFVPKLYGVIADLAQDVAASHVVDALWDATAGMHFLKVKIANELQTNESSLRESNYGRTVWRNWSLDMYQRRPGEWHSMAKGREVEPSSQQANATAQTPKKTAIQLARERHAKKTAGLGKPVSRDVPSSVVEA